MTPTFSHIHLWGPNSQRESTVKVGYLVSDKESQAVTNLSCVQVWGCSVYNNVYDVRRCKVVFDAFRFIDPIGDVGYGCKPLLLTPLQSPRTAAEKCYNEAHGSTRNVIERTFGVLKGCFRCLDRSGGALQYSAEKVVSIIVACCMLHNICQRFGVDAEVAENLPPDPPVELAAEADNTARGHEVRRRIIESYFS
ncbi:putative nuclease HARBI1 [Rhinatrema bivittatum]|uniref:putative nuclease HARBI1 n=1 Tax=Rhinatrema bivittatum TaxID=194408 RepID=UPI00112BDB32|nr:putative nuclease HARBI1 [Rhinatrema bivittatum]